MTGETVYSNFSISTIGANANLMKHFSAHMSYAMLTFDAVAAGETISCLLFLYSLLGSNTPQLAALFMKMSADKRRLRAKRKFECF